MLKFPFTIKEIDANYGFVTSEYDLDDEVDLQYLLMVSEHFLDETYYKIEDGEGKIWTLAKLRSYFKNKELEKFI